jgi:hypothetical protein
MPGSLPQTQPPKVQCYRREDSFSGDIALNRALQQIGSSSPESQRSALWPNIGTGALVMGTALGAYGAIRGGAYGYATGAAEFAEFANEGRLVFGAMLILEGTANGAAAGGGNGGIYDAVGGGILGALATLLINAFTPKSTILDQACGSQ